MTALLAPGMRLHFTGDSITHGHRRPDEIHDVYYLGHGWVCRIAGVLTSRRPNDRLRFSNTGECGHTVRHLLARWATDILADAPDLLTVLIGVNDAVPKHYAAFGPESYAQIYGELLALTRRMLPKVRIVVVEPFMLPRSDDPAYPFAKYLPEAERTANTLAMAMAARHVAAAHADAFVPLQERFDALAKIAPPMHYAVDSVHPTAAGHEVMAQAWLDVVAGIR